MEISLDRFLTAENVINAFDASPDSQENYIGKLLFPPVKQMGMEINKITGRAGLPVALKPSNFDALAPYRERLTFETERYRMPLYRERMRIDEELRQQLIALQASGNFELVRPIISLIFDDTNNLLKGARLVAERMTMELITTGKIGIKGNGIDLDLDYAFDPRQKVTAKVTWDKPAAEPIKDIDKWVTDFKKNFGITPRRAIMSPNTFSLLKNNKSLLKMMYPTADPTTLDGLILTSQMIRELISRWTQVNVVEYDVSYATEVGGDRTYVVPDNVISFIPDGTLGNTVYGTTPEEADLISNAKFNGDTRITETGIAVTTMTIAHPVNKEVMVSQMLLPSLNGNGTNILIASV